MIGIDASAKLDETRDQVARIARAMAGLIDLVTSGDIPAEANVLYAHLGGRPALNAYSGLFT